MAIADASFVAGRQARTANLELNSSAQETFELLCAVEKWPVWLSFLRSARRVAPNEPLRAGSEVVIRTWLPGEEEQLFEVEAFVSNYRLSLVGAFSVRRRFDFRIESRTSCSKLHLHLSYPAYHGRLGSLIDRWQRGRRICSALDDSLLHFKGLVEYKRDAAVLADF